MNSRLIRFSFLALLTLAFASTAALSAQTLKAVPDLDLKLYAGRWYEIARYQRGFEAGIVGTVSDLQLTPKGSLNVVNSGFKNGLDGSYSEFKAELLMTDPANPGRLKFRVFGLFDSEYTVFGLDPKYQWALVGDEGRKNLWIFARTFSIPDALLLSLKSLAQAQGYDLSALYLVPQKQR